MARLVYLGTPDAAVPPLRALVAAGHEVALVVTRADKKRGRGSELVASPVKSAAEELGLAVTSRLEDVADVGAEFGVVVAYGRIIPVDLLRVVPMVNLHFSLLPRWRGAAPVERAILAGDTETGVCLMAVEEGLDTGDVFVRQTCTIGDEESADELRARLVELGANLAVSSLADGLAGLPAGQPQVGEVTYAEKLRAEEFCLDWDEPGLVLHRRIRVGRAWTTFRDARLRILRAGLPRPGGEGLPAGTVLDEAVVAGDGTVLPLLVVQPEGRRAMPVADWRNGAQPHQGERVGR